MTTTAGPIRFLPLVAILLAGGPASAQTAAPGEETLRLIEEGSIDSSPLAGELRLVPIDLRQPTNFEGVYELPTAHGSMFARMDGALRAVFPRSEYVLGPSGVQAAIPAGTTWVIGDTPAWYARQQGLIATEGPGVTTAPGLLSAGTAHASRVDLSAAVGRPLEQAIPGAGLISIGSARFTPTPAMEGRASARPITDAGPTDGEGPIDLAGVLDEAGAVPRTIIAGADDTGKAVKARRADAPAPTRERSPWSDDAQRSRTVAALLERAAGAGDVLGAGEETEAVAGAEATTDG